MEWESGVGEWSGSGVREWRVWSGRVGVGVGVGERSGAEWSGVEGGRGLRGFSLLYSVHPKLF